MTNTPIRTREFARRTPGRGSCVCARGFTLIELILVMSILLVIMGMVAPSLSRFFRGRVLDSEARRLLSLTHYAQSRASSEGIPMLVWLDPDRKQYGLEAEHSYTGTDEKAVVYNLDEGLEIEVGRALDPTVRNASANLSRRFGNKASVMLFQADGFVHEISPREFWLRELPRNGSATANLGEIWFAQSRMGLGYDIQPSAESSRNARR